MQSYKKDNYFIMKCDSLYTCNQNILWSEIVHHHCPHNCINGDYSLTFYFMVFVKYQKFSKQKGGAADYTCGCRILVLIRSKNIHGEGI